jgi:hypothetical protein
MHLRVPKIKINFHYMNMWTFKIKIDPHYVHLWTVKIKINTINAFVSSQDQNRPTMQIHELLNPKQTHIMWTSKTKTNLNYAFVSSQGQMRTSLCIFVNSYNQIKCPLCIFVSSQTKSNSHYMYNLWAPKTKIGPQYAFLNSLTFSHFVFSCKVFNLSHPHMPFMNAWKKLSHHTLMLTHQC